MVSADDVTEYGFNFHGKTTELNAGLRKIWKISESFIRPYIGGYTIIREDLVTTAVSPGSYRDKGIGIWLNGGAYWAFGKRFNIGLDLRYSNSEVTLFRTWSDVGATHAVLIFGSHW